MSIAWITTKFDSELIKTFHTARWEIKSFTPRGFIPCYQFNGSDFDIMIIEVMDRSSLSICEEICHQQIAPVLAIVADLAYAQAVIEAGAEDFLVTPVKQIEALLRVRKLVQGASIVRVGDLEVDLPAWNVSHRGHRLRLSTVEFRLLASLAKRVGQIVHPATILEEVWNLESKDKSSAQVASYIGRVRRKIEPDLLNPQYIISVPGVGYRLRNQRQWAARQREADRASQTI